MIRRVQTLLLAVLFATSFGTAFGGNVELHFIYVGQGDCTLIKTDDGRKILVDCGSTDGGDAEDIRSYLLAQLGDQPELDALVITHPDADHYNLAEQVLEGVVVHKVFHVGTPSEHQQADFDTWLNNHQNRVRLRSTDFDPPDEPSDRFGEGEVKFHILSADINQTPSPTNSRSIVLRVSVGSFQVILTGDGTFATENKILERYTTDFLDVELLKLGHHGSSTTSTSEEWLQAVRPEAAIASAGYGSDYQHPRRSVIDAAAEYTLGAPPHTIRWGTPVNGHMQLRNRNNYGEAIYSTASNGNIVVMSDGDNVALGYQGGSMTFAASAPGAPQPHFAPTPTPQPHFAPAPGPLAPAPSLVGRRALPGPEVSDAVPAPPPPRTTTDTRPAKPVAIPFSPGENVELITRDNISVVGKLQSSRKPGWIHVVESASNRAAYLKESEVVIVKSAQ